MITKKLRERGVKIDNIQRIYIEGVMAESRNYPRLEIGDKVTLDEAEFDSLLSKSYKLSSKSRAIWNTYAKKVRFDSI
jgi:putative lipase involved disintegration of autophagic bodies